MRALMSSMPLSVSTGAVSFAGTDRVVARLDRAREPARRLRHYPAACAGPFARRRRALAALPRLVRAAGLDQRRGGDARQRAARFDERDPADRRRPEPARGRDLLGRGGGEIPRAALRRLSRRPTAGAGGARVADRAVAAAVRGARLDARRDARPGGRRPAALVRAERG